MLIAGVDEAGRGPLAGPVISAAVILNPDYTIEGLQDSKKLSESKRVALSIEIKAHALAFAIGRAEAFEIDQINILQASLLSMQRAIKALTLSPDKVLVDGNFVPVLDCLAEAIIRGDGLIPAISAASILAKVARDAEMSELDQQYPGYGFAQHKGYPTKMHCLMLREKGPCEIHRRSFSPVKEALETKELSEFA